MMSLPDVETLGALLAANRRLGTVSAVPLRAIASQEEAEIVQTDAVASRGGAIIGYAMAATSPACQQQLHCSGPVYGPLLDGDLAQANAALRLPRGSIGAGAGLAFVVGRPYPQPGEAIGAATIKTALINAMPTVGIIGRRFSASVALNRWTATADFGLTIAHFRGAAIPGWESRDLASVPIEMRIDGNTVSRGLAADVMGDPLNAVAWLAHALAERGRQLDPGQIIITGSAVAYRQILPGQRLQVQFGDLGVVDARFA